ncbi:MAG: hypothetical protein VX491_03825 [Pseudomonadota bacterium]|nr:hypothetical protein [Pseudomonadota bacterium]
MAFEPSLSIAVLARVIKAEAICSSKREKKMLSENTQSIRAYRSFDFTKESARRKTLGFIEANSNC